MRLAMRSYLSTVSGIACAGGSSASVVDSIKKTGNLLVAEAFKILLAAMLGALLTYANSISNAQTQQGKDIAAMNANIAAFMQQGSDFNARLNKLEQGIGETNKAVVNTGNRVSVLEGRRYK